MTTKTLALVTGGVGGIGSAICEELVQRGYQVIANYHPSEEAHAKDKQKAWKDAGLDIGIVSGDVSSFASCTDMAKTVKDKFGTVQVLVNCAGITRDKTLKKMEEADWAAVLHVNLDSVFNVTKQFIDGMTEAGFGRVVNISSINGKKGQFGQTNYSAAKAGMHGFAMALAQEVARKGVTVNCVSPGYTNTAMMQAIPEDVLKQIVAQVPMQRLAEPSEIAYVVGFLADKRAGYITGANISTNGGLFISF